MSTLYVGGLPQNADADFLRELFDRYASVAAVRVVRRDGDGPHRGFGYVTFTDATEARDAASKLDGAAVEASRLRVALES